MQTKIEFNGLTPVGNQSYWVTITGESTEYRRVGYAAGAAARKIASLLPDGTRGYRITSGVAFTDKGRRFEEHVLYAFDKG